MYGSLLALTVAQNRNGSVGRRLRGEERGMRRAEKLDRTRLAGEIEPLVDWFGEDEAVVGMTRQRTGIGAVRVGVEDPGGMRERP